MQKMEHTEQQQVLTRFSLLQSQAQLLKMREREPGLGAEPQENGVWRKPEFEPRGKAFPLIYPAEITVHFFFSQNDFFYIILPL
jgi:hypothetical protein